METTLLAARRADVISYLTEADVKGSIMSNGSGGADAATGILFVIALIAMLFFEGARSVSLTILGIFALLIVIAIAWGSRSSRKELAQLKAEEDKQRQNLFYAERKIINIVTEHLETLANRRDTLLRVDRYGVIEGKEWNQEVQHFVDKVVRPQLTEDESQAVASVGLSSVFQRLVEDRVGEYCASRKPSPVLPNDISPSDFEGACASLLRDAGWTASTTKGSGDQGADVIAEKNGRKIVLQCKLYAGAVGNKAVQEVIAAKQFYKADFAAVVCKTVFTKSAQQLAQSSDVGLLTYYELPAYVKSLSGPR